MAESSADTTDGYAALDVAHLQELSEGDHAFEAELLRIFIDDCALRLQHLSEAISSGDDKTTHREAHTIKGAALNIGTRQLHHIARNLELVNPAEALEVANELLAELKQEFDHLCQDVARYLHA